MVPPHAKCRHSEKHKLRPLGEEEEMLLEDLFEVHIYASVMSIYLTVTQPTRVITEVCPCI